MNNKSIQSRTVFALGCLFGLLTASHSMAQSVPATETRARFANIFSDHAVLQRKQDLTIWGYAAPNADLSLRFKDQVVAMKADSKGNWRVTLPAKEAGGPYEITLSNSQGEAQKLTDIMVGDVFLCSGQSNMEFETAFSTNAMNEVRLAKNDNLRFVVIARNASPTEVEDLGPETKWATIGPDTVGKSSAVCYYTAKALQPKIGVPIGMINASWGGTYIEAWMSREKLSEFAGYEAPLALVETKGRNPQKAQSVIAKTSATLSAPPTDSHSMRFAAPGFDDSRWDIMNAKGTWEDSGLAAYSNLDGIVWYRQTITLSQVEAQKVTRLDLGLIDDNDKTFVNGQLVGQTEQWNAERLYKIPAGLMKAGRNVIAVRVVDTGGGGGLYSEPQSRRLVFDEATFMTLPENWRTRIVLNLPSQAGPEITTLYNGMIHPYRNYGLKGVLWYQGESNAGRASTYQALLDGMITDWRTRFRAPDLGFGIVQLANFGAPKDLPIASNWGALREAQRQTALTTPKTGMAVAIDIGDRFDIHPTQKGVLGQRLAQVVQKTIYGQNTPQSPNPIKTLRAGKDLLVQFDQTGSGLIAYGGAQALGFEVCTKEKTCEFALAIVEGDLIRLKGANRPEISLIRYAYANAPFVNLYSKADLPVTPFEMKVSE